MSTRNHASNPQNVLRCCFATLGEGAELHSAASRVRSHLRHSKKDKVNVCPAHDRPEPSSQSPVSQNRAVCSRSLSTRWILKRSKIPQGLVSRIWSEEMRWRRHSSHSDGTSALVPVLVLVSAPVQMTCLPLPPPPHNQHTRRDVEPCR